MRTRAVVTILTAGLAASAAAGGCQILAGLTVLEVGTGGSGSGGAASASSTHGSGTSTGSSGATSSSSGAACMPGKPCGGDCYGNVARPSGTCDDAGACPVQGMDCTASKEVCVQPPNQGSMCAPCGMSPPTGVACADAGCAACNDAGACVGTCDAGCGASMMLDANDHAAELVCNGQMGCNGLTVTCEGPWPCTVVCNGGCVGLTLNCDPIGPCALSCGPMSCMNASVSCGNNSCNVTCLMSPGPAAINCGDSCACTAKPPSCH